MFPGEIFKISTEKSKYLAELDIQKEELLKAINDKESFVLAFDEDSASIDIAVDESEAKTQLYNEYMEKFQSIMGSDLPIDQKMSQIGEVSQHYDVDGFLDLIDQNKVLQKRISEFEKRVETYDTDLWELEHIIEWRKYEIETLNELISDIDAET
ncbi:hypothetical protein KB976_004574 [Vibrio parahaemolyticus]|nr:hypothetical protein [Vibrio parahaemolyticus]